MYLILSHKRESIPAGSEPPICQLHGRGQDLDVPLLGAGLGMPGTGSPSTVGSKLNKLVEHVIGGPCDHSHDALDLTIKDPLSRMTDTTENITYPQLRWRSVMMYYVFDKTYCWAPAMVHSSIFLLHHDEQILSWCYSHGTR